MFKPKFQLTHKILANITDIERFYGNLESKQTPQKLLLNLERNNLIQSSYASNSIEGNPLTQIEVTNLLLNDRAPANRDEKEVVNYFNLLKKLENQVAQRFDINLILTIHNELLKGVDDRIKGQIRNKEVVVGMKLPDGQLVVKHNPPYHSKSSIEKSLHELIEWQHNTQGISVLKAGIFHHEFVYIHPFEDGNGRVSRLLTALLFLKYHYKINKYFVLDDYYDTDRELYSDSLHKADSGDKTSWLEYFTDGVKYSLQSALGKIESGLEKMEIDLRATEREKEIINIVKRLRQLTSADLVDELKISRQQAHKLLKSLVEKGYIKKKGSTKSSYYELR